MISFEFPVQGPEVLILGGVHGDEYEGIAAADGLVESLLKDNPFKLAITVLPRFNPDGALFRTRTNGQNVDLNRNMPTKDWSPEIKGPRYIPGPSAGSEPESQALMTYIEKKKPVFILSLHSWHPVLNVNGDCRSEAEVLSKWTGYRIDDEIGYPTPGCLGTYAGLERQSPTLTYEIQRGQSVPEILKIHVPAIREALKVTEAKGKS
jgi:protein MpaA